MKWFKHDSQFSNDPQIKKLRRKHGLEGYGFYLLLLELASRDVERDLSKIGEVSEQWDFDELAYESGLTPETVGTISDTLRSLGLITIENNKITIIGLDKIADEYTTKLINSKRLRSESGQTPDSVGIVSRQNRIEENRKEKKEENKKEENTQHENSPEEFSTAILESAKNAQPETQADTDRTLAAKKQIQQMLKRKV